MVIPAAIFTAGEKGIFEHANRVHPIYFEYPHEKADDVTIELPPGWQVSSVPPPQNLNAGAVAYNLKVEQSPRNTAADEEVNHQHFAVRAEVLHGVAELLSGGQGPR